MKRCCGFDDLECKDYTKFRGEDTSYVLNCPTLWSESIYVKWKEYKKVQFDNKKEEVQLTDCYGTMSTLKGRIKSLLNRYLKHFWSYTWLNLVRSSDRFDIPTKLQCEKEGRFTLFAQSDYSAQPELTSQNGLNCAMHGVCVLNCWAVLHPPEIIEYEEAGEVRRHLFYPCDHVRCVSPSTGKGKDQDWFLHCQVLRKLLDIYQAQYNDQVKMFKLWTDGSPNQYKCRQNICYLCNSIEGIHVMHRFGATAQFKGIHDQIGYTCKAVRDHLERCGLGESASTAYGFFKNTKDAMPTPKTSYNTTEEKLNKPMFGATRYIWIYASSDADDAMQVRDQDRDNLIVLDRRNEWDSTRIKTGVQSNYEFCNTQEIGRVVPFNLLVRQFPCPCQACTDPSQANELPCSLLGTVGTRQAAVLDYRPRLRRREGEQVEADADNEEQPLNDGDEHAPMPPEEDIVPENPSEIPNKRRNLEEITTVSIDETNPDDCKVSSPSNSQRKRRKPSRFED